MFKVGDRVIWVNFSGKLDRGIVLNVAHTLYRKYRIRFNNGIGLVELTGHNRLILDKDASFYKDLVNLK